MKRIELGNGYVIDCDDRNKTLKSNIKIVEVIDKETKEKKYTETSTEHGHYNTIEGVINKLYKLNVLDKMKEKNSIKEVLEICKIVKEDINKKLKEFDF